MTAIPDIPTGLDPYMYRLLSSLKKQVESLNPTSLGNVTSTTFIAPDEPSPDPIVIHDRLHSMTNINDHFATSWRMFHSNNTGYVVELAFGATGTHLQSTGLESAPIWVTSANVLSSGTPLDNQIAVWTGANTIEGTAGLTYDGTTLLIGGNTLQVGTQYAIAPSTGIAQFILSSESATQMLFADTAAAANNQNMGMIMGGEQFDWSWFSDGFSAATAFMSVTRTLNVADAIDFTATDFNVSGRFSSIGINDDATGERYRLLDTGVIFGTAGSGWNYSHVADDQLVTISGGDTSIKGGNIQLFGSTHATVPGDVRLRSLGNSFLIWDESAGSLAISTGTGAKTSALTIDAAQLATFSGAVTVQGAFTSLGIDDNAASERLELGNNVALWGDGSSGETYTHAMRAITDGLMILSGGNTGADGGSLVFYGSTHATLAGDVRARSSNNTFLDWDESVGSLTVNTGTGGKTTALTLQADQDALFAGSVLTLAATTAKPSINIPTGVAPTSPAQGDMWVTATDIFARINGVSESLLGGGGGDVTKVGTPVDNQIAVWTGDGTIEGDVDLTFDGAALDVGVAGVSNIIGRVAAADGFKLIPGVSLGGWARGLVVRKNSDDARIAGTGFLGSAEAITSWHVGFGDTWWSGADLAMTINASTKLATFAGDVTVQGAFTSLGIDDNASAIRATLTDTALELGASDTAQYEVHRVLATGSIGISGGTSVANGAALQMFGGSHGSFASDFLFAAVNAVVMSWDESDGELQFATGTGGSKPLALTIDSAQNFNMQGHIKMLEEASVAAPGATFGRIWVRNDAPNVPMFTSDTDVDHVLAYDDIFTSTVKGLAPLSGGGTANFLRADGTWNAPAGTGGNVSNSGTPLNNQVAVWTNATTIEGDPDMTFDGTTLTVTNINLGSTTVGDYEEGTWTPILKFNNANALMTELVQSGSYTRIGNIVHVCWRIELSNLGSSTGQAEIDNLPFIVINTDKLYAATCGSYSVVSNASNRIMGMCRQNQDKIDLNDSSTVATTIVNETNFNNTSKITGSATYEI